MKAQLLMALAWFHGVVQERRIFMPQGWTKEYDFSVGDLRQAYYAGERQVVQLYSLKRLSLPVHVVSDVVRNLPRTSCPHSIVLNSST